MRLPITEPTTEIRRLSAIVRPNTKTRRVPAARTRRPTPRLDHSTKMSIARSWRASGATGSTPHSGGRRIAGARAIAVSIGDTHIVSCPSSCGTASQGGRELRLRPLERLDQREGLAREVVDQGAAARAHVVEPPLEAERLRDRDRVPAADHR